MNILYAAKSDEWEAYKTLLTETLDANGFSDFKIFNEDLYKSHDIDFIIYAPRKDIIYDFSEYKNLKAIFSLWAGVETIIENKTIKVPVVKMADEGLIIGMTQWCIAHVLRYHLNLDELNSIQYLQHPNRLQLLSPSMQLTYSASATPFLCNEELDKIYF